MNEDQRRTRLCQEPENLAALRPMALNSIEKEGSQGAMREGSNAPAGTMSTPIGSWSYPEMRSPGSECASALTVSPAAAPERAQLPSCLLAERLKSHSRLCVHRFGIELRSLPQWLPASQVRSPRLRTLASSQPESRLLLESCGCRNQLCPTLPARERPSIAGPRGCNREHQLSGEPRLDCPCSAA